IPAEEEVGLSVRSGVAAASPHLSSPCEPVQPASVSEGLHRHNAYPYRATSPTVNGESGDGANSHTGLSSVAASPGEDQEAKVQSTPVSLEARRLESLPSSKEELKDALKRQLEYYFSRENLAGDAYLLSQMDSQQYVPVETIAGFNLVKRLTSDLQLIIDVLKSSSVVQVDEAGRRVRPVLPKRCIVILREIPQNTPVEVSTCLGCPA
uniref:HTH La-type RNA-binding domain-containing protein n=1 Tax=Eptatretus burgeri TaxID=7764 RepID=A0A8C4Q0G0_EPTBU